MLKAVNAIGYSLVRLVEFRGRATRLQFWPYVAAVTLIAFACGAAAMAPVASTIFDRFERFAAEHPDQVTVVKEAGVSSVVIHGNHPELIPDVWAMTAVIGAVAVLIVLLLAAAVARRLHDRDKPAAWGLMPIPFLLFGLALMPRVFEQVGRASVDVPSLLLLFFALLLNNVLYLASLVFLVVLLCGPSAKGTNRYGPENAA